jgi:hypothetical protein
MLVDALVRARVIEVRLVLLHALAEMALVEDEA